MGVEIAPQGCVNYRVMLMKIFSLTPLTPPQISKRWWWWGGGGGKIEFYNFYLYLKEKTKRETLFLEGSSYTFFFHVYHLLNPYET